MDDLSNCPNCGVSLIGDKIPDDIAHYYSSSFYKREIGIEDPLVYDGIIAWKCPDCKYQWPSVVGKLIKLENRR